MARNISKKADTGSTSGRKVSASLASRAARATQGMNAKSTAKPSSTSFANKLSQTTQGMNTKRQVTSKPLPAAKTGAASAAAKSAKAAANSRAIDTYPATPYKDYVNSKGNTLTKTGTISAGGKPIASPTASISISGAKAKGKSGSKTKGKGK